MKAHLSALAAVIVLAASILSACRTTTEPTPCEHPLTLRREIEAPQSKSNLYRLARGWMEKALVNADEGIRHADEEAGVVVGRGVARQPSRGAVEVTYDFPYEFAVRVAEGVARATVTVGYGMGELRENVLMVTEAHLLPRGDYDELKAQVSAVLEDFTRYVKRGCLAMEHNSKGIAAAEAGDYEGAIKDFTRSIGLNPGYADALNNRGWIRIKQENYSNAALDLSRALAVCSEPSYHNTRGWALFFLGRLAEAREDALAALRLDPAAFNARALLYRVELRQGSTEQAKASLRRYIEAQRNEGAQDLHFLLLRYFADEVPLERLRETSRWDDLQVALRDY